MISDRKYMDENNYKKQLNLITELIDFITEKPQLTIELFAIEEWLHLQLEKIQNFRLRIKELNPVVWDSVLIFDSQFGIIKCTGAFTYLAEYSAGISNKSDMSVLDLITDSRRVEFFSAVRLTVIHKKRELTLETQLKSSISPCGYKSVIQIIPSHDKESYTMKIYNFMFSESYGSRNLNYENIVLKNLPGMDIYLCDQNYRFLMVGGNEKKNYGFCNNQFMGKSFFEAFDISIQKRLYPFFNKTLGGIFHEGEVRLWGNVYNIKGVPVKDEKGFTVAGTLILRNISDDGIIENDHSNGSFLHGND